MFGCCCANKKALKNKEQKNEETKPITTVVMVENDNVNSDNLKSPAKVASDAPLIISPMSPLSESSENTRNGSSEEGNNLSGLIMSDGLVGESCSYVHFKSCVLLSS